MHKLTLWSDLHYEVEKLQKLFAPNLAKAVESIVLTVIDEPGLTKKEIREESSARKQRVSRILKRLIEIGWLKTEGRGVKRDAFKYYCNNQDKD